VLAISSSGPDATAITRSYAGSSPASKVDVVLGAEHVRGEPSQALVAVDKRMVARE
jgi:hypothetical protein